MPTEQARDRRVLRSQALLREALISLIHEKSYDSIVVKEILSRANVGRSTFYTHFRDKKELLVSGIHDMLRSAPAAERQPAATRGEELLRFSLAIFERIGHHRLTGVANMGASGRAVIHEHLQTELAGLIAQDFRKDLQGRRETDARIPAGLLAHHLASTFVLVLNWWVESASPLPPREVDDLFRALVLPAVAAALKR